MPKALDQSIILNLINFISNNEVKKKLLCRDFHTAEWIRKINKIPNQLIIKKFFGVGYCLHFKPTDGNIYRRVDKDRRKLFGCF